MKQEEKEEIGGNGKVLQQSCEENIYLEETINPNKYFVGPGDIFIFNMIS